MPSCESSLDRVSPVGPAPTMTTGQVSMEELNIMACMLLGTFVRDLPARCTTPENISAILLPQAQVLQELLQKLLFLCGPAWDTNCCQSCGCHTANSYVWSSSMCKDA